MFSVGLGNNRGEIFLYSQTVVMKISNTIHSFYNGMPPTFFLTLATLFSIVVSLEKFVLHLHLRP